MTTQLYDITTPEFVETKLEQYDDLVGDYAEARRKLDELKQRVTVKAHELDIYESEIMANGGTQAHSINGSNLETRKAQLKVACADEPTWIALAQELRALEWEKSAAETDMESAQHQLRGCVRALDAAIAHVSWLGAIESRTNTERKWEKR